MNDNDIESMIKEVQPDTVGAGNRAAAVLERLIQESNLTRETIFLGKRVAEETGKLKAR